MYPEKQNHIYILFSSYLLCIEIGGVSVALLDPYLIHTNVSLRQHIHKQIYNQIRNCHCDQSGG